MTMNTVLKKMVMDFNSLSYLMALNQFNHDPGGEFKFNKGARSYTREHLEALAEALGKKVEYSKRQLSDFSYIEAEIIEM